MSKQPYRQLTACRASGSKHLLSVLNLGMQPLSGVFPANASEAITSGPLELVWCPDSGLLQLNHSYDPQEMYGDNYGYRSGLNQSMVRHLQGKVRGLEALVKPNAGDVVVDIGSNDATTLKAYATPNLQRVGIDPTGAKFERYYPSEIRLVPDFFSKANFDKASDKKARIVTSIAMFYDLDDPVEFARQVSSILTDDGVWHFEQSYMPAMLRTNSYDTVCHEHLEYYSLAVVKWIVEKAGLKVIDVKVNAINGGSFAVTAAKHDSPYRPEKATIEWLLEQEKRMGLETPRPFRQFEERVFRHREDLRRLIRSLAHEGKKILGYGASTKDNVLLQFCGLTPEELPAIAEVNEDKFGRVTPGTHIPIISEVEARAMNPDFFLVLPWHFKNGILEREKAFLERGGKMIFPFPEIEIL
jgi:hypothetical protein